VGDTFTVTFSEPMNGNSNGLISVQDADGSTATVSCGFSAGASCIWNVAATVMTVTLTSPLASGGGTTPGLQIPATIEVMIGFTDVAGNPPNLAGSADRVIDFE